MEIQPRRKLQDESPETVVFINQKASGKADVDSAGRNLHGDSHCTDRSDDAGLIPKCEEMDQIVDARVSDENEDHFPCHQSLEQHHWTRSLHDLPRSLRSGHRGHRAEMRTLSALSVYQELVQELFGPKMSGLHTTDGYCHQPVQSAA